MKTLTIALVLAITGTVIGADDGLYKADWRAKRTPASVDALANGTPLNRVTTPKAVSIALQDSPEPTSTGPYGLTIYLAEEPDRGPGSIPIVVLGDHVFIDQVTVSSESTRQHFIRIERINDGMRPAHLLERARKLFGVSADRASDQRTRKSEVAPHEPPPRASVSDGRDNRTLDSLPAHGPSGGRRP